MGLPAALAQTSHKEAAKDFRFLTPPYLQALTPSSVVIKCMTSAVSNTQVIYGEQAPEISVQPECDGFKQANQTLFSVELTGLKPGTRYQYQLRSQQILSFKPYELSYGEEIESEVFSFTTPEENAQSVSCLVLNDIHDRPDSFSKLLDMHTDDSFEFVFLNGDMFDYQQDQQQLIDHLIAPCTALFASEKPFILSRGNHETRGRFARNIKPYFAYPGKRFYYSFMQGPVFFIVLDTGEDKPDDTPVYAGIVNFDDYRREQAQWLRRVMESEAYKRAPFKVVFMHIPPFHSGDWHGPMHCRELFTPLFEEYKIDMVIAGHTHRYGVHEPDEDHSYPIIIGGGPQAGRRTLIHLQADARQLKVVMKSDDQQLAGQYTLKA